MDEIITLLCPVRAAAGRGGELETALIGLAAATVRESGNICYRLHRTDDPDEIIIYEQWKNQAALDEHMATEHLQKFLSDGSKGLLAAEPHGRFLKEIIL
ncbi:MAG: antibiotic biosynthesis monooxygenase [Lentisphaerae bacterium]|nr:antibiotic biosynthesis monooxygenase [Lentisphaerota bacterium]